MKPIWLNTDNSLTLKVLLTMFQGYVSTDETRIILGGYVRDWNRSGYSKLKHVIDRVLKPILVSICVVLFFLILYLVDHLIIYFWNIDILAKNESNLLFIISVFVVFFIVVLCVVTYYFLVEYSKKMLARIFN